MLMFIAVCLGTFWSILVTLITLPFKKKRHSAGKSLSVGLFHPYCNAGGGGERVLWAALKHLQIRYPNYHFVVYTGDNDAVPEDIIASAKSRFNIILKPSIEFVYLDRRKWVEASYYPSFTLLGQSIGSVFLGLEAFNKFIPDVFVETMGYAFTLPIFRYFGGCRVGCYVHYPTISTDMLEQVSSRTASYNNRSSVAKSNTLSYVKLQYYKCFAWMYSWCGRCSDVTMVNSSWTEDHVNRLWKRPRLTHKVYPPCDVETFTSLPLRKDSEKSQIRIVSVAQFRPEKDHPLQLKTLRVLRSLVSDSEWSRIRLVLVGSCRNSEDALRVQSLRDLARELGIEDNIELKINVSYSELKNEMGNGLIGLHTMWNEHFGIGVVECMAAGLITIAHNSGGPKMDIVVGGSNGSRNGFLATTESEYAKVIQNIIGMGSKRRTAIRKEARTSVGRFSEGEFSNAFLSVTEPLLL